MNTAEIKTVLDCAIVTINRECCPITGEPRPDTLLEVRDSLRDLREHVVRPEPVKPLKDSEPITLENFTDLAESMAKALAVVGRDLFPEGTVVSVSSTPSTCYRFLASATVKPPPEPVDLSALREHLDDYPVDPSVQKGLDQAARGELVMVDDPRITLSTTPSSYIEMVRKHRQRAWEAVSDEIWAKSEPDDLIPHGIPYFLDLSTLGPKSKPSEVAAFILKHYPVEEASAVVDEVCEKLKSLSEPPESEWKIMGATISVPQEDYNLWPHTLRRFADRLGKDVQVISPRDKADTPAPCVMFDLMRGDMSGLGALHAVVTVKFSMLRVTRPWTTDLKEYANDLRIEAQAKANTLGEPEAPEPPDDWNGCIKLRISHMTGLESVQPAYFEPLIRRMMYDNKWLAQSNVYDLRTGRAHYLEIVYTDDDGAITKRSTL